MALQKIIKNGTETGATAADKVNAIVDMANAYSTKVDDLETATAGLPQLTNAVATNSTSIADNSTDIISLTADTAANTAALVTLNDVGLLSLARLTPTTVGLTTSYQAIGFADNVNIDASRGCFSYNAVSHQVTVLKDGIYNLIANGSIEGSAGIRFEFTYFVNGIDLLPGAAPGFTTEGAGDPVAVADNRFLQLTTGDVIDIRAKRQTDGDLTIVASSLSIEKLGF